MCDEFDDSYDDYDDFGDDDFEDEDNEPVDSCENCECDVYECDGYFVDDAWYCSQCAWSIEQCNPGWIKRSIEADIDELED